jgi:hypothetical protein
MLPLGKTRQDLQRPPQRFPQQFWPGQRLASKPVVLGKDMPSQSNGARAHALLGRGRVPFAVKVT